MSEGSMTIVELETQIWVFCRKEPVQAYSLAIALATSSIMSNKDPGSGGLRSHRIEKALRDCPTCVFRRGMSPEIILVSRLHFSSWLFPRTAIIEGPQNVFTQCIQITALPQIDSLSLGQGIFIQRWKGPEQRPLQYLISYMAAISPADWISVLLKM